MSDERVLHDDGVEQRLRRERIDRGRGAQHQAHRHRVTALAGGEHARREERRAGDHDDRGWRVDRLHKNQCEQTARRRAEQIEPVGARRRVWRARQRQRQRAAGEVVQAGW